MGIVFTRFLSAIPLVFGVTVLSFFLMHMAPGDPTDMYKDPTVSHADLAQIRHNLGLDKPVYVQYGYWLKKLLKGDLGFSYVTGQPVLTAISERIPATLLLSVSSLVLILLLTFPLGILSGYKAGSGFDHVVTVFSFIGMAIPTFWLGLMFILFFSVKLSWFPTSGYIDPSVSEGSFFVQAMSISTHLVLPLLTITVGGLAGLIRYFRFGIIAELTKPYIIAARARGLSEKAIVFKHAFKNSALPILTILGLQLPGLLSGAFVIEYIFAWPGLGKLGVDAVFARDYPVLMGTLLVSSLLIVVGNLLSDLSYQWVDPRIKRS